MPLAMHKVCSCNNSQINAAENIAENTAENTAKLWPKLAKEIKWNQMKLKCKRRQHAQALVSSLSHLSLLQPLLSLSHAHTHAHTLGLPYKFLSDRVAVVSPCFPICFGCVRTSVLANAAVIIHGTNCVYYNIPLRLANKRTAVQTDSRTEGLPDRQGKPTIAKASKGHSGVSFLAPCGTLICIAKKS